MAINSTRRWLKSLMGKRSSLFAFLLCGFIGVLVDLDHLVSFLLWKYWNSNISEGRILHTPILIICCLAFCFVGTYLPGLYNKLILILVVVSTIVVLVFSPNVIWSWTR